MERQGLDEAAARININEFEAAAKALVEQFAKLTPTPEQQEARLSIGFRTAVTMLQWFADRRTMGAEDMRAGRTLYSFVQARLALEQRKSLYKAFAVIARGWAPECAACGRRMRQMTDNKGREVAGAWSCDCGAWFGKEMDSESRKATPHDVWVIDRTWQRRITRKKGSSKSGSRRRRRKKPWKPEGPYTLV